MRCQVTVRPRELSRLLSNLVTNAIEHGGGARVALEGRSVVVANPLRGELPGDDFYERGQTAKRAGRGLGLYWSRKLAEEMGASLTHALDESADARRIRFTLDFGSAPTPGAGAGAPGTTAADG